MEVYHSTYGQGTLIQHNDDDTSDVLFNGITRTVPTAELSDVVNG